MSYRVTAGSVHTGCLLIHRSQATSRNGKASGQTCHDSVTEENWTRHTCPLGNYYSHSIQTQPHFYYILGQPTHADTIQSKSVHSTTKRSSDSRVKSLFVLLSFSHMKSYELKCVQSIKRRQYKKHSERGRRCSTLNITQGRQRQIYKFAY